MSPPDTLQLPAEESFDSSPAVEQVLAPRAVAKLPPSSHETNGAAAVAQPRHSLITFISGTLFRKGALSLVDQGIVSATNFLTMVLLGRTSAQELGEYQLGFSLVLLATCAQNALISSPYALFGNRLNGRERANYAGSTLLHQWALSALSTVLMVGVALATVMGWGLTDFDYVAWILAGMLPFILVREFVRRVAFAHLHLITVLCIDGAASALQLGGLIALKSFGYLSSESTFATMGVACAISGGATFFLMRRNFAPRRANALADLRLNWSFGKWAFGSQLVTLASGYGIPWMLALFLGTAATGRYSACLSIVMIANPLLIGLNNFLTPQAIHAFHLHGLKGLKHLTWGISVWVTGTLAVLTVLLVLFGSKLLTLLYGQKLNGNELTVALLALNTLAVAGGLGVENGLIALNRPAWNFWAHFSGLTVMFVSACFLIIPHGVSGAALACLIGITTATCTRITLFIAACRWQSKRSVP